VTRAAAGTLTLLVLAAAAAVRGQEVEAPRPAASVAFPAQPLLSPPHGVPLGGPELEAATQEVSALLRCPVCQGLSVADSPTELARNMKQQARELLAAGYDREQVLAYFESSYGEFVRLEPPLRGINWLVWVAPVLGSLAGGFLVTRSLRRLRSETARVDEERMPDQEDDPRLTPYLRRVREMAYGWPEGRPPSPAASAPPATPAPPSTPASPKIPGAGRGRA
jgi:cytochrome c-type biogenesis protein CcmH